jgi:hypothetical protein
VALVVAQQGAAGVRGVIESSAGGKAAAAKAPASQTTPPQTTPPQAPQPGHPAVAP